MIPGSQEFIEMSKELGPPFYHTCRIRSSRRIHNISLDDCYGEPHITCLKGDNIIIFKSLNKHHAYFCTVLPMPGLEEHVRLSSAASDSVIGAC